MILQSNSLEMAQALGASANSFLRVSDSAYSECSEGIANLDRIIVSVSSSLAPVARGFFLPILYAYWERFFKIVFSEYLRCIEQISVELPTVHPKLAKLRLKRELNEALNKHSIKQVQDIATTLSIEKAKLFFEDIVSIFGQPVSFIDPTSWVDTESNVNYQVLEKNCENVGVEINLIKKRLSESEVTLFTALNDLVGARNQISHGELFKEIKNEEWEIMKNYVLAIMNAVQLELFETLKDGRCLKKQH
jgi:hypothetical protein